MPLVTGTRLGPYEIVAPIGAGGMGEVYKARDPRLNRTVAIKISAQRFTERFGREARAIASLNHTNICHLYDVGPDYLVMEYVEGAALKGPLPFDEALPPIHQLIDGIEAAHEHNIIHRDLKPANIKVTPEGVVKILDFGLAKAAAPEGEHDPDTSPTETIGATTAGTILGTASYMAPEQARGKTADRRSDIWAFGAMVYELLTGKKAFVGETVVETLSTVISQEPDWTPVPPRAQRLLKWCLEKDRKRRLQWIGDARRLLEEPAAETEVMPESAKPRARSWLVWILAAAAAACAAMIGFLHFREKPPSRELMRFEIPAPENTLSWGAWLSPDGRNVAFVGVGQFEHGQVWVRALDSLQARPLAGTDGANVAFVFWSPDSRSIVFQDLSHKLKKVELTGSAPDVIADLPEISDGGAWARPQGQDGVIVYSLHSKGLMRIPEHGGAPAPLTLIDPARHESFHLEVSFLPDQRHFVYIRGSTVAENNGVYLGSIDAKPEQQDQKRLLPGDDVVFATSTESRDPNRGYLLFAQGKSLIAQPFDTRRLQLTGTAGTIAENVETSGNPPFSASTNALSPQWRAGPTRGQPTGVSYFIALDP